MCISVCIALHVGQTFSSGDLTGLCVCVQLSRESELQQKLQEEQFCLLQCAVVEAEGIILDALAKVDDPMCVRCVCTPGMLLEQASMILNCTVIDIYS